MITQKGEFIMNYEFLNLYEELLTLNEAKADTQRLIDFAGEDLANRFLVIKNRLKSPENDLYYWIKNKTPADLEAVVLSIENSKSNTQLKKDIADEGAKLISETAHWKIYHITTFEASQKYGRDSKWCITGAIGGGDKYWKDYTSAGIDFYFLITKGEYDPRGTDSKFAVAVYTEESGFDGVVEIYNQQDRLVKANKIPYHTEIEIPNVDLNNTFQRCRGCGGRFNSDELIEYNSGEHSLYYCKKCFDKYFCICFDCKRTFMKAFIFDNGKGEVFCTGCKKKHDNWTWQGVMYELHCSEEHNQAAITGFAYTAEDLINKLTEYMAQMPSANSVSLMVASQVTGEVLFDEHSAPTRLLENLEAAMETTDFYWDNDVEDIAFTK